MFATICAASLSHHTLCMENLVWFHHRVDLFYLAKKKKHIIVHKNEITESNQHTTYGSSFEIINQLLFISDVCILKRIK